MRIVVDIDGTICSSTSANGYQDAKFFPERIDRINKLYEEGHYIILYTGRGSSSGKDYKELTKAQLDAARVSYNELRFNKLPYDIWIDDKSVQPVWLDTNS